MSQHLTRKEIKRDEFASAVGRSVEYAEAHSRGLIYIVAGVIAAALLAGGGYYFLGRRAASANTDLAYAMKVFSAPVVATGAKPDDRESPSFATAAARQERARTLFEKVHGSYPFADAADIADLYLAQIAASKGELDRARELWTDFLDDHEGHVLAGEARLNLIRLDRQQGKGEELIGRLRPMLDEAEPALPQDVVLFELGQVYEQLNRRPEAVASYRRIADEFPQSAYKATAQLRLTEIDPGHSLAGGVTVGGPGL